MKKICYALNMNSTQQLLTEIEAYIAKTGINESAFGYRSMGDRRLLNRLRTGSSVTLHTADAIRLYMKTHPPRSKPRGNGRRNEPRASAA